MRLTTKIILGIILSIFAIALTFIIGFSFTDREKYNRSNLSAIDLPQDNMTGIELASFKTILIDEFDLNSNGYNYGITDMCNIFFDSVPVDSNPDMLFIPDVLKEFISVNTSNDTLVVKLNLLDLGEKYRTEEHRFQSISGVNMHFNISKLDIVNKAPLSVIIKNVETDSIKIVSNGDIFIDSCKALLIDPQLLVSYRSLKVTNSDVKRIDIDFDNIRNWNIENCNIEEEFFTGSGRHDIIKHRNEASNIMWVPKNKDARLNIGIQGDTTQIIIR